LSSSAKADDPEITERDVATLGRYDRAYWIIRLRG